MKRKLLLLVAIVGIALVATPAFAITYYFTNSNNGTTGNFGSATVSLIAGGAEVVFNWNSPFLLDEAAINGPLQADITFVSAYLNSTSLAENLFSFANKPNMDGFGTFSVIYDGPNFGNGGFTQLTFDIAGTFGSEGSVLSVNLLGNHAAVHYQDPSYPATANTFYASEGPAVPIPPSALLLGSGLLGMGLVGWRRKKGQA